MRRTKEDAEQTRRDILASAMDIFYEKGYSKTTFDEIAKRINLTKGAVYWYFRNKPDIVAALINEFASQHIFLIDDFLKSRSKPDFSDIIDVELLINEHIRQDSQFAKFLFFITCQMEWSETIISKIMPSIEQTKKITRNLFTNMLTALQDQGKILPNTDISVIADILISLYGGLLEGYFTKRLNHNFDDLVKTGFNLIFNSIKTEGEHNENKLSEH